jgi:hypothetical protein
VGGDGEAACLRLRCGLVAARRRPRLEHAIRKLPGVVGHAVPEYEMLPKDANPC